MNRFKWIPIYVTRHTARKTTGHISLRAWQITIIRILVLANIIGWSIYGLAELVGKVV